MTLFRTREQGEEAPHTSSPSSGPLLLTLEYTKSVRMSVWFSQTTFFVVMHAAQDCSVPLDVTSSVDKACPTPRPLDGLPTRELPRPTLFRLSLRTEHASDSSSIRAVRRTLLLTYGTYIAASNDSPSNGTSGVAAVRTRTFRQPLDDLPLVHGPTVLGPGSRCLLRN